MGDLDAAGVASWLRRYATVIDEKAGYLTELDAAIGDADHGTNMNRGMRAVGERVLSQGAGTDLAAVLKQAGMTLISTVGGASGPLYGTLFMRMAQAGDGTGSAGGPELGRMLAAGIDGVRQRGRAQPGDKTMLDSLLPALEAYGRALDTGADTRSALEAAVAAADEGCQATVAMKALKGRASYLGERSVGHQDPGATSSAYLLRSLLETIEAA